MAIIGNNTQTQAVQLANAKQQIDQAINNLFVQMRATYITNYNAVWNSADYTPADILALYGVNGAELFRLSALLAQTINDANAGTLAPEQCTVPAGVSVTVNQDGSVTVG